MLATDCYSPADLDKYSRGCLDDVLNEAIEAHLATCAECEKTLCHLDSDEDTLVRTLKLRGGSRSGAVPNWVDRMAESPLTSSPSSSDSEGMSHGPGASEVYEPCDQLGDYQLERVLGRGGMSVVFAARHQHLGREVALKVMLPKTQQQAVSRDRFAREMRAVGGLDHPSIVRATDAGECDDTLYLVMEQIDGVDLNRISKAQGPLSVADACAITIEVALGLEHAHRQGIVHRDIKPSNVMLDRRGKVKILDFGLARMQSAACDVSLQTTMGQLLGTLDYMAPEQASGGQVDPRADVYALGATLFKLLAGQPPHGRSAEIPIIEFLHRLANDEASSLSESRESLPVELVELVGSMLQRDPEQRIATAAEVAKRLARYAAGSDLRKLATTACQRLESEGTDDAPSVKATLSAMMPSGTRAQPVPAEPASPAVAAAIVPPRQGGRGSALGWVALLMGLVSLAGLAALTVALTLKSEHGEIRIESDLPDVNVEIVDERDHTDLVSIDHGEATTTVKTGRYRIRLKSPSDGVEITPEAFTVRRGDVIVARIKKIGTVPAQEVTAPVGEPAAVPGRDPVVALEAQLELTETAAELAKAREETDRDDQKIRALEEKMTQLRALSRPIPTEPVYQGRTLADWTAQMRFEQESAARETAAQNVLRLAKTLPPQERCELVFEANSRLSSWRSELESGLASQFQPGRSALSSRNRDLIKIDRSAVSREISRALLSDEPRESHFALLLCADLREQLREGEWPEVLQALRELRKTATDSHAIPSQLTFASAVPDDEEAIEALVGIDLEQASDSAVLAMLYLAEDRRLAVPRGRAIRWVAEYFNKLPYFDKFQTSPVVSQLWSEPTIGPFNELQLDPGTRDEANAVISPLLDTFASLLDGNDERRLDERQSTDLLVKSVFLCRFIDDTELTGPTRDRAVTLLKRRLTQLLTLRAETRDPPDAHADTPSEVAVAIMLLTGEFPEALREPDKDSSGFLARQLKETREALATEEGVIMFRGGSPGATSTRFAYDRSGRYVHLAAWYPLEMMEGLQQYYETLARVYRTSPPRSSRSRRSERGTMFELLKSRVAWRPDSRLMIEYAGRSDASARFVAAIIEDEAVANELPIHPRFENAVARLALEADNRDAALLGLRLWRQDRDEELIVTEMLRWLEVGDAMRVRLAIEQLDAIDREQDNDPLRLTDEWAEPITAAVDRIAADDILTREDLEVLHALGDRAPNAEAYALAYLQRWLSDPDWRKSNALSDACAKILLKHPERLEPLRVDLQETLLREGDTIDEGSFEAIQEMWSVMTNAERLLSPRPDR